MPSAAVGNFACALEKGIPVVSGTTGWTAEMPQVEKMVADMDATLFWSSNFSIGVNLFMRVNAFLAGIMEGFPQYGVSMKEIHHIHKLDHPSGTAITLAEGIIANNSHIKGWTETGGDETTMVIEHQRQGEVPGTHIVSCSRQSMPSPSNTVRFRATVSPWVPWSPPNGWLPIPKGKESCRWATC